MLKERIAAQNALKKFATLISPAILATVRSIGKAEGRQLQDLIDEALTDLIEKRRQGKPRAM